MRRVLGASLYALTIFLIGALPMWSYVLMWPWPSPLVGGWMFAAVQVASGGLGFVVRPLLPAEMRADVGSTAMLSSVGFAIPAAALVVLVLGPYWELSTQSVSEVSSVAEIGDDRVVTVVGGRIDESRDAEATHRASHSRAGASSQWDLRVAPIVDSDWTPSTPVRAWAVTTRSRTDIAPMTFATSEDGLTLIRLQAEDAPSSVAEVATRNHALTVADDARYFEVVPSIDEEVRRLRGQWPWYAAYLLVLAFIAVRVAWSLTKPPKPPKPSRRSPNPRRT